MTAPLRQFTPDDPAPPFAIRSLAHGEVRVPDQRLTHLQFRRFAGCPICSLHLRGFARRHDELTASGIREVAIFHASRESLERYHADLPFAVLPDPEKQLYERYGLQTSLSSMLHPRAMGAALVGMFSAPHNPIDAKGGLLGLPADFLINSEGTILKAKYGKHGDDHWEVDDVLGFTKSINPGALEKSS